MFDHIGRLAGGIFSNNMGGVPADHFDKEYCCYPVSFCGKDDLEKGNKILLPQSALNDLARMNVTWPMLFRVSNAAFDRVTHSGVLEFIAEEGTCYMPYWMMQNLLLKEGDVARIVNTSLPKGTYVKLQPVNSDFLTVSNPKAVLENSLRHFATLTVGDNIVIQYNNKTFEIEIVEAKPSNAISIIETDVKVDFAPPKDALGKQPTENLDEVDGDAQKPDDNEDASAPQPPKGVALFSGSGVRLDGKPLRNSTPPSSSGTAGAARSSRPTSTTAAPSSSSSSSTNPTSAASAAALSSSPGTDTQKRSKPWLSALPGGVRRESAEYEAMKREAGRIPGVMGRKSGGGGGSSGGDAGAASSPTAAAEPEQSFSLFSGSGHTLE